MKKSLMGKSAGVLGLLLASPLALAAGALEAERLITLNAPAATVWKMVGNFNGLDVWHPAVSASELTKGTNNQVGAERLLTLGNGATIAERLLSHSDTQRSYSYAILQSPLPVKNYESTISVEALADGRSQVRWRASFDASGAPAAEAVQVIDGIYAGGLGQLSQDFPD